MNQSFKSQAVTGQESSSLASYFKSERLRVYQKGEIIIGLQDPIEGCFYVDSGFVRVLNRSTNGNNEFVYIIYGPGDVIPIGSLIQHHQLRSFYEAMDNCRLYMMRADTFNQKIETDIKFANVMLKQACIQLTYYTERVLTLEMKFARERLVSSILFLAQRFGRRADDIIILPSLSQRDIAVSSNLSRESVSREIERLMRKGLIDYNKRIITIKNLPGLLKEVPRFEGQIFPKEFQ